MNLLLVLVHNSIHTRYMCVFLLLFSGFRVEILVRNEVSAGIIPPSPPLYRLGSSMTLFCRVFHASGPLSYSWSTTARSRFTSYSTSVFNRKAVLTAADAGVYTCSVSDSDGNTQQDSVEMKFNGKCLATIGARPSHICACVYYFKQMRLFGNGGEEELYY